MILNVANRTLFTGDNLVVLRGMNSASVDLIYLDPPFNLNRHYESPIGSEAAGAASEGALRQAAALVLAIVLVACVYLLTVPARSVSI